MENIPPEFWTTLASGISIFLSLSGAGLFFFILSKCKV